MKVRNPIIMADYPDPDVIRAGDTYYMLTAPGKKCMVVLSI